jgi:hypothetical protein
MHVKSNAQFTTYLHYIKQSSYKISIILRALSESATRNEEPSLPRSAANPAAFIVLGPCPPTPQLTRTLCSIVMKIDMDMDLTRSRSYLLPIVRYATRNGSQTARVGFPHTPMTTWSSASSYGRPQAQLPPAIAGDGGAKSYSGARQGKALTSKCSELSAFLRLKSVLALNIWGKL